MRTLFTWISTTASLLLLLVACTPSPFDAHMATLRDDPIVEEQWPQLESRSTTEQAKGEIMAGQPSLTRCLVVEQGTSVEAMDLIVDTARNYGWEPDPGLDTETTRVSHRSDPADDRLSLIVSTDGVGCEFPGDEAKLLRLTLTYS